MISRINWRTWSVIWTTLLAWAWQQNGLKGSMDLMDRLIAWSFWIAVIHLLIQLGMAAYMIVQAGHRLIDAGWLEELTAFLARSNTENAAQVQRLMDQVNTLQNRLHAERQARDQLQDGDSTDQEEIDSDVENSDDEPR